MSARSHPRDPSPRVAIAIGVIALAAAIASVMPQLRENTWIFRDGRFYVNVATTIVEDLSLDQHAFAGSWYTGTLGWNADLEPGWSNVALGARGEHWPKHPWIHPLIASPVFFALGLPGTLAWNLLMFAVIAAGLHRFARAYASPASAAMGVAIFVIGTAILQSAYDFSVDVLMLALFAQGLAAVLAGRGAIAGVCIALCVVIKPTALMLMPALLLTIAERRDRATLARSLGSGTLVLLAYAAINWWMYGRPWWSGYNRTLVTRHGEPVVADHLDAFSTPFAEGFAREWSGYYGLSHTFTAMVLAAPGLVALLRRRPLHALGAILGVALSLVVFAKYEYEGHRFHWPALALLVPSLATTIDLAIDALRVLRARTRLAARSPLAAGRAAGLAVIAASAVSLLAGASAEERVRASGPWGEAALDAAAGLGLGPTAAALAMIAVHLAIAGLLASRVARLLERVVPAPLAAFAVAACALVPEVREAAVAGGPIAIGGALAALAAERAIAARDPVAGRGPARRALVPLLAAALALLALALLPDRGGELASLPSALSEAIDEPAAIRLALPWLILALPGLVLALRRDPEVALALGALALVAILPGVAVRGARFAPITTLLLAAPAALTADALARAASEALRRATPRRAALAIAATLAVLLAIGGVRRAIAAGEPFRLATQAAMRDAIVLHRLAPGRDVPCDFLAWEHMSWECSHFDSGLYGMVGLAVSDPIRVGGIPRRMMVLPTGRSGQERIVRWEDVRAGRALVLRWAVPDDLRGDATLVVRAGERELASIDVPPAGDDRVHEQTIDTAALAGERATLELSLRPREGRRHQATIAVDALWR